MLIRVEEAFLQVQLIEEETENIYLWISRDKLDNPGIKGIISMSGSLAFFVCVSQW